MPNLRKVELDDLFSDTLSVNHFRGPDVDLRGVSDFVLEGGSSVWDLSDGWFPLPYLRRVEGYGPRGLPEDNTEPDDPILDYEQDDIDTEF